MGTSVILDILGSMIIGGILLLTLFQMNDNAIKNTYNFSGELIVQQNLATTVEVLEYDFRKIGYCENPDSLHKHSGENAIIYANKDSIVFWTDIMVSPYNQDDLYGDGTWDKLVYYFDDSDIPGTPNPHDRMLYRIVNDGTPRGINLGVTKFTIRYFRDVLTAAGSPALEEIPEDELPLFGTGTPTGITALQIDIQVENTASYDAVNNPFRQAFWRQIRLSSRNIDR